MSTTIHEYKCPCCSGAISFDTSLQKMKCPYCDTEFELEALEGYDADLKEEAPDQMEWSAPENTWSDEEAGDMVSYVCQSCAGEIIAEKTSAATFCPFCGSPVIVKGNLSGDLKPDLVIPFQLDKKAATEALTRHLCHKRMLPKAFKDENHIQEVRGVYVPFWLFDASAEAQMRYRAVRVRHWSDARYHYTARDHFSVIRCGTMSFDAVPVDGAQKMPDDLMESIEPFDYSQAVDFQTAYLSGFLANRYDVTSEDCVERANQRIKNSTEAAFSGTVQGYSSVTKEYTHVSLTEGTTKYALLPVWMLTTQWKGQTYLFAMNGQTGKFVGNLPTDWGTYHKWLWGLTAAVSAGILGLTALLHATGVIL